MGEISHSFKAAALVPGLPHLLRPELNQSYRDLASAMEAVGDRFAAYGVERILYYSTQWISVLGQSFQARTNLQGEHVDENWHDLPDLPFSFEIDRPFAEKMASKVAGDGHQTKLVHYDGFPVDTGTIVADRLINRGRFRTGMVSTWVYADGEKTAGIAKLIRETIDEDRVPTAVVGVSLLSGRFFTTEIDMREDRISDPKDDAFNKKVIACLESANVTELDTLLPDYLRQCKVDMGFKALDFLRGAGALRESRLAKSRAYGAIYGTGAAVIEF